ncbi:HNH endonuclease, partial [Akkermansiaceae bacterium]|nr:HNH endonuclease [Akkermansiaceae bacterium]
MYHIHSNLNLEKLEYWLKCYKEFESSFEDLRSKFPRPSDMLLLEARSAFFASTSRALEREYHCIMSEWASLFRKKLAEIIDDFVREYGQDFCFRVCQVHYPGYTRRAEFEELDGVKVWWLMEGDSDDYLVGPKITRQIISFLSDVKTKKTAIRGNEIEAKILEKADRRLKKRRQDKALLASAAGTSRNLAASIKRKLVKGHPCPYCGKSLGSDFHADHIYPVIKGGLSTIQNMVNVCSSCNLAKGDLTLSAFIKKLDLNRNEIESRLENLG